MQRIVAVDAHAAVQVLRRVDDALAGLRGPELGDRDLRFGAAGPPASRHAACQVVSRIASVSM